jgi:hypothetical protein
LETFTEVKALMENPHYQDQRKKCLAHLSDDLLDEPIVGLVNAFNKLPYCFTIQSCYGHFVYTGQKNPCFLNPLPNTETISKVQYRIAYIALCIENSDCGRMLLNSLSETTSIDPENIQLCCAEWFWKRQVNSYALQVEPDRYKSEDKVMLDYREALKIQRVRDLFFAHLKELSLGQ